MTDFILPEPISCGKFLNLELHERETLVAGLLAKGERMILAAPSKAGKSWAVLDLAKSLIIGKPWLGLATRKSRVLCIDIELPQNVLQERLSLVFKETEIEGELDIISLHCVDFHDSITLIDQVIELGKRVQYDVIIIDPLYRLLGEFSEVDELATKQLLVDCRRICRDTSAALILTAHFPKGNPAGRCSLDRVGGSGVWTRDPDCIVTLTPHNLKEHFTLESTTRGFPEEPPFVIKRVFPTFIRAEALNPSDLGGRAGAKTKYSVQEVLDCLPDTGAKHGEWMKACEVSLGMTSSSFNSYRDRCVKNGKVQQLDKVYHLVQKAK